MNKNMNKPKALIFSGYGLNSEEETAYGFQLAAQQLKSFILTISLMGNKT